MSLLKLLALGIQSSAPMTYSIIYNTDNKYDNQCQSCVKENKI